MSETLPRQHGNSLSAAWSIAADNQLREQLEAGFQALVGAGVLAGGGVSQTGAFAVELAAGTTLFTEGVALTLGSAIPRTGLNASATNYLWGLLTRTARDRSVAAAVDAFSFVLTHNATGIAPNPLSIPLSVIVCDGSGITSITDPAGKYLSLMRHGRLVRSVAGGSNVTLSATEARYRHLVLTGLLTASIAVILPLQPGLEWLVDNQTTGAYTVTVKGATGTGTAVPQGGRSLLYATGADILPILSGLAASGANSDITSLDGLTVWPRDPVRTVTASGSVTDADHMIRADCTSGPITLTLPTATGRAGKEFVFKKVDSSGNALSIASVSGQTFDGALSPLMVAAQWDAVTIYATLFNTWELR